VERAEADAIFDQGREVAARVLLELSAQSGRTGEQLTTRVARQEERIAQLERQTKRSSRSSSQPPASRRSFSSAANALCGPESAT